MILNLFQGPMSKLKMKSKISVVLATYNEEKNIKRCLESIKDIASEIIIVDGSSTDNTREISERLGAKVFKTTNKPNFHINKQMAIDKAMGDWILQLDADEVITPALSKEIIDIINSNPEENAFWIKRKNYFLGTFLKKGGQYPDPAIRLFRRGKARLPQKDVHEYLSVEGKIGTLSEPMEHYYAPTFERYLINSNRYTSFSAKQYQENSLPLNIFNSVNYLLIKPIYTFLLIYIRHKGFVDGFPGFVFALFSGLHHATSYMKYWELVNNKESTV